MKLPTLPIRLFAVGLTVGFVLGCLEPLIKVPIDDRSDAGLDGGAGGGDGGQLTCGTGLSVCSATCVNLQGDDANCGACRNACAATEACARGTCLPRDCSVADCSAQQVCQNDACLDRLCVGVMCTMGQVCVDGQCRPGGVMCGGLQCPPQSACINGQCVDPACVGVRCPQGTTCLAGACVSGCMSGATCTPTTSCAVGAVRCDGGMRCEAVGTVTPGTSCGTNQVCDSSGVCGACTTGSACDAGPCQTGAVACDTGAVRCVAQSSALPGTSCGAAKVCGLDAGCLDCAAGSGCDAGTCQLGAVACGSGAPVCQSQQPAPAGTQCGANDFCNNDGGCLPCQAGAACSLTNAPCFNGTQSCTGGVAVCNIGTQKAPGSVCGFALVCAPDAGCINCATNAGCDAGACFIGSIACGTGIPTCAVSGVQPLGTQTNPTLVCTGDGGSNPCTPNSGCDAGICRSGSVTCGTGAAVCSFTSFFPAGTPVGAMTFCDGDGGVGACTAGTSCSTGNACENGVISCGSGAPVCVPVSGAGQFKSAATECRASMGTCDVAEFCTGSAVACPADALSPSTAVCRAAGADATCNPAESCTGSSAACPTNVVGAINTPCGSASTVDCDAADTCDGAGVCVTRFKSSVTTCRPAGADPTCDPAEACTGASATCPVNSFAANTTSCGSASNVDCDAPDTCSGAGTCTARFKSGVVCRNSGANATCDPAEVCPGNSTSCPGDFVATIGTACTSVSGAGTCQSGATCLTNPQFVYNGVCGTSTLFANNATEFICTQGALAGTPDCGAASCTAGTLGTRCLQGSAGDQYRNILLCMTGGRLWVSPGPGVGQCGYVGSGACSGVTDPTCASVGFTGGGAACSVLGQRCAAISGYRPDINGDLLGPCSDPMCTTLRGRIFVCADR